LPLSDRAFSLIEVVTVMLLMGIVAAIALPRYSAALCNYRVSAAARQLSADLVYAQTLARSSSSTYTVTLNPTNNSYQLSGGAIASQSGGSGPMQLVALANTPTSYVVSLQSNPYLATIAAVSFSDATTSISFNGYGIPSTGGAVVIQCGAAQKTLTIDTATGAVSTQ
jgi:prepilin-type N-terminal cleavage/methylation domain-containing protein